MEKDGYDIINELGPRNWLDNTAGEAVVLGQLTCDPELTMKGTMLAKSLSEIRFDNDNFSKVEAEAIGLGNMLENKRKEQDSTVYLDEICEYEGGSKSLRKWEYDLFLKDGLYVILMYMPEYIGRILEDEKSDEIEKSIISRFQNPRFDDLKIVEDSKMMGCQKMDTTDYYTDQNTLICHKVDFDHECGWKRGTIISYYIADCSQAMETWIEMKAISNQKR